MHRHSGFPKVQGWRLRFEFVPQHPISARIHPQPVECHEQTSLTPRTVTFLYPRFRPSTSNCTKSVPSRRLSQSNVHSTALTAPYSHIRICPSYTGEWNSASYSTQSFSLYPRDFRDLKTIRTMADPVLRTASPYIDPTVKGPKSQQLSSGHSRSLLQDHKSQLNFAEFLK